MHPHIGLEHRPIFCSIVHADHHSVSHPRAVEEKQTARLAVSACIRSKTEGIQLPRRVEQIVAMPCWLYYIRRYKGAMDLSLLSKSRVQWIVRYEYHWSV